MRDPKWMGSSPSGITWSPDSRAVIFSWNPDRAVDDSFYTYYLQGPHLQGRDLGGRDLGGSSSKGPMKMNYMDAIKMYAASSGVYNSDYSMKVHIYRGDLYLTEIKTGQTKTITQTEEPEFNPKFILNNEWIAYNRGQNIYAWNIKSGTTKQLTNLQRVEQPRGGAGARTARTDSTTKPLSQEQWLSRQQLELFDVLEERKAKKDRRNEFLKYNREMDTLRLIDIGEKSLQALEVSPSGSYVSYRLFQPAQGKQTIVPDYVTESGYTTDLNTRTKVGATQGRYEYYLYDKNSNREYLIKMDSLPGITDLPDYAKDDTAKRKPRPVYVASTSWNPSGTVAMLDIYSQDNKDRWLMKLDPITRKLSLVDRQRDEAWIGGPGISPFNPRIGWVNNNIFYFQSEATGYSHLYLYDLNAETRKALTAGKYEVQQLVLSKTKKYFYLVTNEEHPGKQHWYRINIDGSGKSKITNMEGGYEVVMSPDEKWIAYRYSYINKPWELYIQENKPGATPEKVTDRSQSEEFTAYPWREARVITIPASDGARVFARLYEPESGKKNNAAVIFVHGAGYLQNAHYWWSSYFREYMFHNLLVDKGYTVLDIDYRGSAGYGRDWRTGIYRHMGGKDLSDHVDASRYLTSNLGIDPSRIGIYGGSYGGFITLMALFTTPDVFKAGAALRPVTDWAHYNHGYTSNILNEPFTDSIAYARSSPINFASGLKNHLLICHGMVDVNVHFQDVVRLSQKLIELGKENWELAVYPVEDHGFVEPTSWADEYKRILKLFDEKLLR